MNTKTDLTFSTSVVPTATEAGSGRDDPAGRATSKVRLVSNTCQAETYRRIPGNVQDDVLP